MDAECVLGLLSIHLSMPTSAVEFWFNPSRVLAGSKVEFVCKSQMNSGAHIKRCITPESSPCNPSTGYSVIRSISFKDDKLKDTRWKMWTVTEGAETLYSGTVENISLSDSGQYICILLNADSKDSEILKLTNLTVTGTSAFSPSNSLFFLLFAITALLFPGHLFKYLES